MKNKHSENLPIESLRNEWFARISREPGIYHGAEA